MRNIFQKFFSGFLLFFLIFSPFFSLAIPEAQAQAESSDPSIYVRTTGYSIGIANSEGTSYSGSFNSSAGLSTFTLMGNFFINNYSNIRNTGMTTKFVYSKVGNDFVISSDQILNAVLGDQVRETIPIERNRGNLNEQAVFYSAAEMQSFSRYVFQAVAYFNDAPDVKYYGNVVSMNTGRIPLGPQYYPELKFYADPVSILVGERTYLFWSSKNTKSCVRWESSKPQYKTDIDPSGFIVTDIFEKIGFYTFSVTCKWAGGEIMRGASVWVKPRPATLSFSVDKPTVEEGDVVTFSWSSVNTKDCTLRNFSSNLDLFSLPTSGSRKVTPYSSSVYSVRCAWDGGFIEKSVSVGVWGAWGPLSECEKNPPLACESRCLNSRKRECIPDVNKRTYCLGNSLEAEYFYSEEKCPLGPPSDLPPPPDNGPNGLVPCGNEGQEECQFDDVITLINTVITFIFEVLVIPFAAIMFAYAGFLMVSSGGSPEKRNQAKGIFTNVAIGLIIALAAFLVIQTLLKIAGARQDIGIDWFGIL